MFDPLCGPSRCAAVVVAHPTAGLIRQGLAARLDATNEAYVRRKLHVGGYSPPQVKHVQAWLVQRDAEHSERRDARDAAVLRRATFWTMVGAFAGVDSALVAVVAMFVTKAGSSQRRFGYHAFNLVPTNSAQAFLNISMTW